MPELPEVETVRRTLAPHVIGARVTGVRTSRHRLRAVVDEAALRLALVGRRITGVRRRAKYLLLDTDGDAVLLIHLGMTGRLSIQSREVEVKKHDHVVIELDYDRELRFNDARRFGLVEVVARVSEALHVRLASLGVEPLERGFSGPWLYEATRGSRQPIKTFLMDARRVVGVGNIYASEALFAARIHPKKRAGALSRVEAAALARAVKNRLRAAILQGGTTLRDFADTDGELGYFAVRLRVYGRHGEACPRCGTMIEKLVQAGRSTFFCPRCQARGLQKSSLRGRAPLRP